MPLLVQGMASPLQSGPPVAHPRLLLNAAMAVLRNLSFSPESKTHLLVQPLLLPSLVGAAEAVAENAQGAAYASSALWAMMYHGEKVGGRQG